MSSSKSLEEMKTVLFDVREEVSELNAKHQLLLEKQDMLMEKIDQLINQNNRQSQGPLPLPSPLEEQSVPRNIPTPKMRMALSVGFLPLPFAALSKKTDSSPARLRPETDTILFLGLPGWRSPVYRLPWEHREDAGRGGATSLPAFDRTHANDWSKNAAVTV